MDVSALIATWDARREETEERIRRHFPDSDDMLAVVLRGHLLVEEFLDRLNRHCLHFPKYYDQARLSFRNKLLIARAQVMVPHRDPSHFFEPLSKLNELRNNVAHSLDAPALQARVEAFLSAIEAHYSGDLSARMSDGSVERRLRGAISFLLGQMELMDYVVEFMEKSRRYGAVGKS